jgi:hypothetical protein
MPPIAPSHRRGRDHRRRPQVRLPEDEGDDRPGDEQERDRPASEAADELAPIGHPVGQVDDQPELRDLGRMDRRQGSDHQPPRRSADDPVERWHEDQHEQPDGHEVGGHGQQAQDAVVDLHHHDHRDEAERPPQDLRSDDREGVVALDVGAHGR